MKYIPIKTIANALQFRTERVQKKLQKLGINITKNNAIKVTDALKLGNDFLYSKRTSKKTKEKAVNLLKQLEDKLIKGNIITKNNENSIIPPLKDGQRWYKKMVLIGMDICHTVWVPFEKLTQIFFKKCVHILEGIYFKFLALIVAISVQMHHSAIWFQRVTPEENTSAYAAYGYAFMVDLFILVVTMEGRLSIAKTFATLTFLSNVLYFQFWVDFDRTAQAYTNAISSLLISGIMAYIIYAYTELFVKYRTIKR